MSRPHLSSDWQWRWDGYDWVPNEPSPPAKNAKNMAIWGMVLSIIGAFVAPFAIPGLILGVAARRRIDRLRAEAPHELVFARGGDGRGFATTAKVLGIVDLVGWGLGVLAWIAFWAILIGALTQSAPPGAGSGRSSTPAPTASAAPSSAPSSAPSPAAGAAPAPAPSVVPTPATGPATTAGKVWICKVNADPSQKSGTICTNLNGGVPSQAVQTGSFEPFVAPCPQGASTWVTDVFVSQSQAQQDGYTADQIYSWTRPDQAPKDAQTYYNGTSRACVGNP